MGSSRSCPASSSSPSTAEAAAATGRPVADRAAAGVVDGLAVQHQGLRLVAAEAEQVVQTLRSSLGQADGWSPAGSG
jgi:hypothetical protein